MKKLYFSLYSYVHNYCIEALLADKSPVFPSDTKHCASWVNMVNNVLLLEKKFGFSHQKWITPKVGKLPAGIMFVLNREQEENVH